MLGNKQWIQTADKKREVNYAQEINAATDILATAVCLKKLYLNAHTLVHKK